MSILLHFKLHTNILVNMIQYLLYSNATTRAPCQPCGILRSPLFKKNTHDQLMGLSQEYEEKHGWILGVSNFLEETSRPPHQFISDRSLSPNSKDVLCAAGVTVTSYSQLDTWETRRSPPFGAPSWNYGTTVVSTPFGERCAGNDHMMINWFKWS